MQQIYKITSASILATMLTACGGGGSSPAATTDPIIDPITDPITEPVAKAASSLQIIYGKVTNKDSTPLSNVIINTKFFDQDKLLLSQLSTQTDINGNYEILIPKIESETGLYVTANFLKEGFSEGEKALDISEEQISLSLDAILSQVTSISIKRSDIDALAFGADGESTLQLSLITTKDGKQQLLFGDVSAAGDVDSQLSLSIPSANLPESIEVINGELAYFDSSNADDIQNFPGEFLGAGETEQQGEGISFLNDANDEDEYRLISSTFSQIKLTDQNGDDIELSDTQAADGSNPTISLKIPKGSYSTIEKDFDLNHDGIQIPIFVYKSSKGWQYVGNGLLVDAQDNAVGPNYPTSDPVIVDENGNLDLTGYNTNLHVLVEIVEGNKWLKWINLDWPIKATTEVTSVCFTGSVNYNGGESYSGMTGIRLPDGGFEWVYIKNGSFSLNSAFTISEEQAQDPDNWEFSIKNAKTGKNETISLPNTVETGGNCNDIEITLFNPYQCQLEGQLFASDGITPVADQVVTTVINKLRTTLITSNDGTYQQSIACDDDFTVSAFGQNKIQSVSSTDSPITVNFSKENQPPILGLSSNGSGVITEGETALVKWSYSDPEDDAVSITIESCSDGENKCSWEENTSSATLSFPSYGNYTVKISANDGHNTVTRELIFEVKKQGNQTPKISGFELNGQFYDRNSNIDLVVGQQDVSLLALVSDVNGDTLSFEWQGISCVTEECVIDTSQAGEYPITLTVNDNNDEPLTTSASLNLVLSTDQPPEAELLLSEKSVMALNGVNTQEVSALLLATDDLTAQTELVTEWTLTLDSDEDYSSTLIIDDAFNVHIETGDLPLGEYQLTAIVTDINIHNESGQSTSISSDLVVTADQPPTIFLSGPSEQLIATASGTEQSLTVSATIADDLTPVEQLTLDWSISPEVTLTTSDDNLDVTVGASDLLAGDYTITATLSDGQQQVTSEYSFTVIQDKAPLINMTVTPSTQDATEQQLNTLPVSVLLTATDDFSETLDVQWQITPDVAFTATNTELTIPAETIATGQYQVQAQVTDSRDQISSKTISFNIKKHNGNVEIIID